MKEHNKKSPKADSASDSSSCESWKIEYHPHVYKDFKRLDHAQRILVVKAIRKVARNPLPASEGGYGKPLGAKRGTRLTGLYKIKLRDAGLRVAYYLCRVGKRMVIVVVGVRADHAVYEEAQRRMSSE